MVATPVELALLAKQIEQIVTVTGPSELHGSKKKSSLIRTVPSSPALKLPPPKHLKYKESSSRSPQNLSASAFTSVALQNTLKEGIQSIAKRNIPTGTSFSVGKVLPRIAPVVLDYV